MAEIQAPHVVSSNFLLSSGRALMRWWNGQGPSLPPEGEAFRAWWQGVDRELRDSLAGPGLFRGDEIWETLQQYAGEAADYYRERGAAGPPPPGFADPRNIIPTPEDAAKVLWPAAVVVLGLWLLTRRI